MHIVLIDDDTELAKSIIDGLTPQHTVVYARTGDQGENAVLSQTFDVIILDLKLPDRDGVDLCKGFRNLGITTPILILTGSQKNSKDAAYALNVGADDYITKPFLFDELYARLNALFRRSAGDYKSCVISVAGVTLDTINHIVCVKGQKIFLRPKEYQILKYLMLNAGRTVSRAMILEHAWSGDSEPDTNSIDVHIKNLRKKLQNNDMQPIRTIHGYGYMLDIGT